MVGCRQRLAGLLIILLLGAQQLTSPSPARAFTCSPEDIWSAAKNAYDYIPSSCYSEFSNSNFWLITAFLTAQVQTDDGAACLSLIEFQKSLQKEVQDYEQIWKQLPEGIRTALQENGYVKSAQSYGADAMSALNMLSCACYMVTNQALGDLHSEMSQCVGAFLCEAQDWLYENVSEVFQVCSTPTQPPQLIDCGVNPCVGLKCDDSVPVVGALGGQTENGYVCLGNFCYSRGVLDGQGGNYCFCPEAMQKKDSYWVDLTGGTKMNFVQCGCPAGTKPAGTTGMAAYTCLCENSGIPVAADGSCPAIPPPCESGCPNNQVVLAKNTNTCTCTCGCQPGSGQISIGDQCVTPCSDPTQIMLASGTCCAPSQATSCGTCCPAGMKPDASGNCVTPAAGLQVSPPPTLQKSVPASKKKQ